VTSRASYARIAYTLQGTTVLGKINLTGLDAGKRRKRKRKKTATSPSRSRHGNG
jgi:hypothetical protein